MKPSLRFLIILLSAALSLSGCTLQFSTALTHDGSGIFNWEYSLNKDEQKALAQKGSGPQEFCQRVQNESALPPSATVTQEQHGEDFSCIARLAFTNLTDLRNTYAAIHGVTVNQINLTDNELVYDIEVNIPAGDPQLGGLSPLITWTLTPPGTLKTHNADKVKGNALTWDLKIGEPRNIHVETSIGFFDILRETLDPLLGAAGLGLLCLGGLLIFGGGFYWFKYRQKRPAA